MLVVVPWGTMANTVYKCLHAGLDERRAFDASEWERGPNGRMRFVVLKKRTSVY